MKMYLYQNINTTGTKMDIKHLLMQEDGDFNDLRIISHIINNLYISGMMPLSSNLAKNLEEHDIGVVISMTEKKVTTLVDYCQSRKNMEYYHFPCEDIASCDISKYFDQTFEIIHKSVMNDINVLVHCMEGSSRSVTIVIAFLMRFLKSKFVNSDSYDIIYNKIKEKRNTSRPNRGFQEQLRNYSRNLKK